MTEMFSDSDIKAYLTYKGEKRPATIEDLRKKLNKFAKLTNYRLSSEGVLNFVVDRVNNTSNPQKYINPAMGFIRWLQNVRNTDYSHLIKLLEQAPKPVKTKKAYAEEGSIYDVTLDDVHTHILSIYRSNIRTIPKLRAITASALAASTGLRPEELKRLEPSDLYPLDRYFILPAEKSKTHTSRVIPIHPQISHLLRLRLRNTHNLFPDGSIRYVFDKAGILTLKQFRKFFAIHSARIGFPDIYRIAIAGHDTDKLEKLLQVMRLEITEDFYRKFTPLSIVTEYIKYWGKVEIVPAEVEFV